MELITVIAVIGIVITIFAQRMQITETRRVELQATQLVRWMDFARTRAIANRQMVRVKFYAGSGQFRAYVDHDRDGTINKIAAEQNAWPEFGLRELDPLVEFGRGAAPKLPADPSGSGKVTFSSNEVDLDSKGITEPMGTRGTIYLTHRDNPEVVAAVYVSGSASFRVYRYVNGAWQ